MHPLEWALFPTLSDLAVLQPRLAQLTHHMYAMYSERHLGDLTKYANNASSSEIILVRDMYCRDASFLKGLSGPQTSCPHELVRGAHSR